MFGLDGFAEMLETGILRFGSLQAHGVKGWVINQRSV
jgi:hypothetical protein